MPASFMRCAVAVYLDYCFFAGFWDLFHVASGGASSSWLFWIAFVVLWNAGRFTIGTPGRFLLSIDRDSVVDPEIKESESWLTVLLGVIFASSGASSLFAGIVLPAPVPQFGVKPDLSLGAAICAGWGALNIFIGYLLFRLNRGGFWLGIASTLLGALSFWMSIYLMPSFVREIILARQEVADPRVVEMAVAIGVWGSMIVVGVLTLVTVVGLGFSYPRLARTA